MDTWSLIGVIVSFKFLRTPVSMAVLQETDQFEKEWGVSIPCDSLLYAYWQACCEQHLKDTPSTWMLCFTISTEKQSQGTVNWTLWKGIQIHFSSLCFLKFIFYTAVQMQQIWGRLKEVTMSQLCFRIYCWKKYSQICKFSWVVHNIT